jgi:hypothetical protein
MSTEPPIAVPIPSPAERALFISALIDNGYPPTLIQACLKDKSYTGAYIIMLRHDQRIQFNYAKAINATWVALHIGETITEVRVSDISWIKIS